MERELAEYFGALVVVELRNAVARVTAGEPMQSMVIGPAGDPKMDFEKGAPLARRQLTPVATADYSLSFTGTLFPAQGGRVHVCYEHEGHIVKMTLRPEDIVAVSAIESKVPTRIERPASA